MPTQFEDDDNRGPQMLRVVFWGSVVFYVGVALVILL